MAGFEVTLYGRFWLTPEVNSPTAASKIRVHWINPITGGVANNAYGNIVEVSVEGYSAGPLAPFRYINYPLTMWARAYDMMESVPPPRPCITKSE